MVCGNSSTYQAPSGANHKPTTKALAKESHQVSKCQSVNVLHLKDRRLILLVGGIPTIDQEVIEIKVEWMREMILYPQVLGLFLIKMSGMLLPEMFHLVTVIHLQMRCVAIAMRVGALRLQNGGRVALERNQMVFTKMSRTLGWCTSIHT